MKVQILLLSATVALALFSIARAGEKALAKPPVQFLQTENRAARRALATQITADFREAPIREVIDDLLHKGQINTVMKLDADPPQAVGVPKEVGVKVPGASDAEPPRASGAFKNEPRFTRKFQGVRLRTVLYQLSQDTGLIIEWRLYENKPVGIMIRNH